MIPAARGAAAEVPVWASVHSLFVSVVDYYFKNKNRIITYHTIFEKQRQWVHSLFVPVVDFKK